ncbi:TonB-dependent receptor [Salinimicrobium flavum]|uniref:TonB-dependent receptor domain-containing protein n=1 Tax=Salinimicrobium flavum TaxID=1737065 RepID=A0ABW5IYV9_9FLAO
MKNLILGLLFMATSYTYSQHSITGTVHDEKTGEPVVGASVFLQKPERGTITNFEGEFTLSDVAEGRFNLIISSLGYGTRTIRIIIPLDEDLAILLSPTAIEMEEVIISTPFHKLQSENVMKVERATVAELNRTGAVNLSEGITKIAGVETVTTGAGIGKPVIRGLSSNRVLVYTQGVRLENQQFGDEHSLGISSSGTESVEVIKGPASLLYGSDALGGVLYLNPERYAPSDSTAVDAGAVYFSNTLGVEANAGFKTSGEKLKFLLRGNYATHSDYETGEGEKVTNTRFDELDLKAGLGYRNDDYKGDLRYNLNSSHTGIPEEIGDQTSSKDMMAPYQSVQNHILSLDNSFYFDDSSLDVKLGYLFNNRKEYEEEHEEDHEGETEEEHAGHEEGEPALKMHLSTFNYDLNYHFPQKGKFETILGIQGMYQTNENLGEEFLIPDATTKDIGILATTHYHLEKIDFQGGLRYDHRNINGQAMGEAGSEEFISSLNRSFNSYNGALGVKVDFTSEFTGRLNVATGFRAPNLAELTSYGSHHGTNRFEIGNPDLENEQNYQLDLALEFRNEHFEIFTNAFYNSIDNYIFLDPTEERIDENPVFEYVQHKARLYGGEAGLHIHPHPLDWLHLESSYEMVIGKQAGGEYLPLIPAHSVLNTFRVEFEEQDWIKDSFALLSLKTVFDQNKSGSFETETSGYSLLNAGFGGAMKFNTTTLELQLSGNNLLNKTYISHLSRLKPDGIPNMGRNISLKARVYL